MHKIFYNFQLFLVYVFIYHLVSLFSVAVNIKYFPVAYVVIFYFDIL